MCIHATVKAARAFHNTDWNRQNRDAAPTKSQTISCCDSYKWLRRQDQPATAKPITIPITTSCSQTEEITCTAVEIAQAARSSSVIQRTRRLAAVCPESLGTRLPCVFQYRASGLRGGDALGFHDQGIRDTEL